jgi:hypothetical protein
VPPAPFLQDGPPCGHCACVGERGDPANAGDDCLFDTTTECETPRPETCACALTLGKACNPGLGGNLVCRHGCGAGADLLCLDFKRD